ncbi:Mu transposase C-terminal domain-containing protein [Patulibacter minatonensis]|uniref:Mu transposase C-terminal domain-containing protein n=1 Tax=Patulibacter minatonensis TaxID=298163 RepID=UPI00047EB972|nr:Mu transposase C-terminal domain-containing protein [Patulibacter minatonensis]
MDEGRLQSLTALSEDARAAAMDRWTVLRPTIEEGVPLARSAAAAGVAPSTARRWLARYEAGGLAALARRQRSDSGVRRTRPELVALIEGLALRRPPPSAATIARRIAVAANERGWPVPSYSTVAAIVAAIDPAVVSLAHDGPEVFRDRFELVFRRRAERPNDIWQADHTELDLLVLDADGRPARPWLTLILDDHSRAVAGYSVFLGAPSALNLSLALRHAVWMKPDPGWPVHGLPDVLHVDHGSDFTSHHIEQVAVDLHVQLVYSAIARPQGRGKVERLFGTVTQELLPDLPGHLVRGEPASAPALSLAQLDAAIGKWITGTYHQRVHPELGSTPVAAWLADGWLPRRPPTLEALDLLLVMVARARVVHRDGIRFQGLRYFDPTLAGYVGRAVTIRFDPRDLSQVRVFLDDWFLCRAVSPEHAGGAITLKDVQAARVAHRRAARARIADGRAAVAEYLPRGAPEASRPRPRSVPTSPPGPRRVLHTYAEDAPSDG